MMGKFVLPRSLELKPRYQIQFYVILRTPLWGRHTARQHILRSIDWADLLYCLLHCISYSGHPFGTSCPSAGYSKIHWLSRPPILFATLYVILRPFLLGRHTPQQDILSSIDWEDFLYCSLRCISFLGHPFWDVISVARLGKPPILFATLYFILRTPILEGYTPRQTGKTSYIVCYIVFRMFFDRNTWNYTTVHKFLFY